MSKSSGWSVVALHFGYVESSLVSPMIFVNRHNPPKTKLDAVRGVARWFLQKWMEDNEFDPEATARECCETARAGKGKKKLKFCGECGKSLDEADDVFDVEDYRAWLVEIQGRTADGFGWDGQGDVDWYPWGGLDHVMKVNRVVHIVESAENVLTYALCPEELPKEIAGPIAEYQATMIEHHAENRLNKRGLDIAGLVDVEARALTR